MEWLRGNELPWNDYVVMSCQSAVIHVWFIVVIVVVVVSASLFLLLYILTTSILVFQHCCLKDRFSKPKVFDQKLQLPVHIFVCDGIVCLQSIRLSWPHRFAVHIGVNASVSSRYITATSAEFEITLRCRSLFFILREKEEKRERWLKPKSEIRNEREIETERDERRMVEWTERAGE